MELLVSSAVKCGVRSKISESDTGMCNYGRSSTHLSYV